jgi:hypothetical protein
MAPIAKMKVAENATQSVSQMLPCTSLSLIVSSSSAPPVLRNIPASGARINSNTSEERISIIQLKGLYFTIPVYSGIISLSIF